MSIFFTILREGDNQGGRIIWTEDQIAYIVKEYQENYSVPTIAKQFGVSGDPIRRVLRNQGVKLLTLSEIGKLGFPRNSQYFKQVDSNEKAYWLGFLYADSYINKTNEIRINLSKVDEDHLQKFLNAIGATNHTIKYSEKRDRGKVYYQAYISIRDTEMTTDLAKLGCVNNKSLRLVFPTSEQVPKKYVSHFIRGYFDGDGSIHYTQAGRAKTPNYRISFTGTKDMLEAIRSLLGKPNLAIQERENFAILQINGNKQLEGILEYIYKDSTPAIELERKKEKYEEFLLQRFGD